MKKYTTQMSASALVIALGALGCTIFQNWDKDWSSVMFAVAMLSALAMILIGWNIYTVIDSKREIKEIKELVSSVAKVADNANANIKASMFSSLMAFYEKTDTLSYEYLHNALLTIMHTIRYGDMETAKRISDKVLRELDNGLGQNFTGIQKSSLVIIIANLQEITQSIITIKDRILNLR